MAGRISTPANVTIPLAIRNQWLMTSGNHGMVPPARPRCMNSFFGRAWTILMLLGVTAYVFHKGVVPALSAIDSDFPGYFTAARIVIDGQDTGRLYDDDWFREQIRHYGLEGPFPGKFAPFPPPTALLLVPLARFEPLTALRILTALNVLCVICSIYLLAKILAWNPVDSALLILSSGLAIISGLRFGQPYILASTFCILGYYLYLERRHWLAGICFGLFVPIKYFPVIILAFLAFRKEWKVLLERCSRNRGYRARERRCFRLESTPNLFTVGLRKPPGGPSQLAGPYRSLHRGLSVV